MAYNSDYEGDDDIVAHYENEQSDDEGGIPGLVEEEATAAAASDSDNDNDSAGTAKRRVDPSTSKVHAARNPLPKLNTERLKGSNGIQTIEKYFDGFKFHGRGHEKADLDRIMKRLEHWSYRLFPKYHFDDFLARVEQLGTKKDLQVYIKKYRLDMLTTADRDDLIIDDDADSEDDKRQDAPLDDFDLLISEQIQKQKQAASQATAAVCNDDAFDRLFTQSDNAASSQLEGATNAAKGDLSDELKEKIERNKRMAMERRLQRQREHEEEEEAKRKRTIEISRENHTSYGGTNASPVDDTQTQIDENNTVTEPSLSNEGDV